MQAQRWNLSVLAAACLAMTLGSWAALPAAWDYPDAIALIRTAPLYPRTHTIRVPIPPSLQGQVRGARAQTIHGDSLPCYLLSGPRTALAAEIRLSFDKDDRVLRKKDLDTATPINLYLFSTPVDAPPLPRTSVVFMAGRSLGVARPGTCANFLGYWRRYAPLQFMDEIPSFGSKPDFGRLEKGPEKPAKRNFKVIWHLSTTLNLSISRELNFGVPDALHGAWFLFVDRRPVFSWGEAEHDDLGYLASPRQVLEQGPHQIDFFGILEDDEVLPTLAYREVSPEAAYQRFGEHELWSPNEVMTFELSRPDDVLVQGFNLELQSSTLFAETGKVVDHWTYRDLSHNLYGRSLTFRGIRLGNRDCQEAEGSVYLARAPQLPIQLEHRDQHGFGQQLSVDLMPFWTAPKLVNVRFQPVTMPYLAPSQFSVPLNYNLQADTEFEKKLLTQGRLLRTRYDRAGKLIDTYEDDIPPSPFRRYFTMLQLARDTARIDLSLVLGGFPVAQPISIYHVLPGDPPAFTASAGLLRYRDGLALLAREQNTTPTYTFPPAPLSMVMVVDDFIATASHPYANLTLQEWLAQQSLEDLAIQHLRLHANPLTASLPRFEKFTVLPQVLKSDAQAVVWAIGQSTLQQGISIPDFRTEVAFLAETTLAHGKLPILMTPPILGDWTHERLRPYALAIMQLGAHYDIPVVDLFSASLKRQNVDAFYRLDDQPDLLLGTPNAKGRAWYFQQILTTIQGYQPPSPAAN